MALLCIDVSRPRLLAAQSKPSVQARRPLSCRAALSSEGSSSDPGSGKGRSFFRRLTGAALSLFHPYKRLPADGKVIDSFDEECNPEERNCRSLTYVYESPCECCSGSGWARSSGGSTSRSRRGGRGGGRRAPLHTCLACHGLGHVRVTSISPPPNSVRLGQADSGTASVADVVEERRFITMARNPPSDSQAAVPTPAQRAQQRARRLAAAVGAPIPTAFPKPDSSKADTAATSKTSSSSSSSNNNGAGSNGSSAQAPANGSATGLNGNGRVAEPAGSVGRAASNGNGRPAPTPGLNNIVKGPVPSSAGASSNGRGTTNGTTAITGTPASLASVEGQ